MLTAKTAKKMEYHAGDNLIGCISGILGGMVTFLHKLFILDMSYWESLWKAGLTAVVCGVCGVGGKHLFTWAKEYVLGKKWFSKKK